MVRVFDMDEVLEAPELVLQFCLEICLLSDASLVKPLVYSMIQYLLFKRKKTKNVSFILFFHVEPDPHSCRCQQCRQVFGDLARRSQRSRGRQRSYQRRPDVTSSDSHSR